MKSIQKIIYATLILSIGGTLSCVEQTRRESVLQGQSGEESSMRPSARTIVKVLAQLEENFKRIQKDFINGRADHFTARADVESRVKGLSSSYIGLVSKTNFGSEMFSLILDDATKRQKTQIPEYKYSRAEFQASHEAALKKVEGFAQEIRGINERYGNETAILALLKEKLMRDPNNEWLKELVHNTENGKAGKAPLLNTETTRYTIFRGCINRGCWDIYPEGDSARACLDGRDIKDGKYPAIDALWSRCRDLSEAVKTKGITPEAEEFFNYVEQGNPKPKNASSTGSNLL